jgi:hypothetical protein
VSVIRHRQNPLGSLDSVLSIWWEPKSPYRRFCATHRDFLPCGLLFRVWIALKDVLDGKYYYCFKHYRAETANSRRDVFRLHALQACPRSCRMSTATLPATPDRKVTVTMRLINQSPEELTIKLISRFSITDIKDHHSSRCGICFEYPTYFCNLHYPSVYSENILH